MTPVVSERTLKDGSNELQIRFESPAVDGLRLVKTYTLQARRLHHRRASTSSSTTATSR